ncbi:MAG: ribonuclease HI family protein [Candidatus Pacebacteria bacterium]|nr:ribonuclease HI family protein [Candidatus Paceibacterota bacterium]
MSKTLFGDNSLSACPARGQGKYVIYTDGGARGNPSPAAIGVVINSSAGIKKYGEKIGSTTNNVAEYTAVIFALKKLKLLVGKKDIKNAEADFKLDSELAVKQLNGEYKVKEEGLQKLFMEIWNLKLDLKKVSFMHIPREQNKEADKLVNEALDN